MSAANGGVDQGQVAHFNLTPEAFMLMVDLHISVLSGSSVEPDNTNGSKSNHQHKERFLASG